MSSFNVFAKFAHRMNFVNTGLAFASVAMATSFLLNSRSVPDGAIIDPVIGFGVSGIAAVVGIYVANYAGKGYNPFRDGLPFLVFSAVYILAGNQRTWAWTLLAVAVVVNVIFLLTSKHGDLTEEEDRITLTLRWPF